MSAPLLLTDAELQELTGKRQPARMVRWLIDRGWIFEAPSKRGEIPKVDRSYYLAKMSGQIAQPRRHGPRLDFMLQPR